MGSVANISSILAQYAKTHHSSCFVKVLAVHFCMASITTWNPHVLESGWFLSSCHTMEQPIFFNMAQKRAVHSDEAYLELLMMRLWQSTRTLLTKMSERRWWNMGILAIAAARHSTYKARSAHSCLPADNLYIHSHCQNHVCTPLVAPLFSFCTEVGCPSIKNEHVAHPAICVMSIMVSY